MAAEEDDTITDEIGAPSCGCHTTWEAHQQWIRVVVVHDLMQRNFADICTDDQVGLTKDDIAILLHGILYRHPTATEIDEIFAWLDVDGDGIIDPSEWHSAQWRSEVEFIAGSARAATISLLSILGRVLPRIPVIKFFRPRAQFYTYRGDVPSASRLSGVSAQVLFMAGSVMAATVAFMSQRQVREYLAGPLEPCDDEPRHGVAAQFVAGGLAGALHATIMAACTSLAKVVHTTHVAHYTCRINRAETTRDIMAKIQRRLPGMVVKDVVGFSLFFGTFHVVQQTLEERLYQERASSGESFAHRPRTEAVVVAGVSGACAGLAYHTVSHPMERAQLLAPRGASVQRLLQAGWTAGASRLFHNFSRNGALARSIIVGTVTFASYDMAIRFAGQAGPAARLAPPTTRDAMCAIEAQRDVVESHAALGRCVQSSLGSDGVQWTTAGGSGSR